MAPSVSRSRDVRRQALTDARRALILSAAWSALIERGIEGASLREIAKRAGYTPGALYSYFANKEEVYGALLGASLDRLVATVETARDDARAAGSVAVLRAVARAFFEFYRASPRDLDLGFYLFPGVQPRGLTPDLDRALNARLRDALRPAQDALRDLGMAPGQALAEVTALFAHTTGLLLLGHTGRIRMFGQAPAALLDVYLDALVARSRP